MSTRPHRYHYTPTDKPPQLSDYDKRRIYRLYWLFGYEYEEIAPLYGVHTDTVRKLIKAMGIPESEASK